MNFTSLLIFYATFMVNNSLLRTQRKLYLPLYELNLLNIYSIFTYPTVSSINITYSMQPGIELLF